MKYIKQFGEKKTFTHSIGQIQEVIDEFKYILEDEGWMLRVLNEPNNYMLNLRHPKKFPEWKFYLPKSHFRTPPNYDGIPPEFLEFISRIGDVLKKSYRIRYTKVPSNIDTNDTSIMVNIKSKSKDVGDQNYTSNDD